MNEREVMRALPDDFDVLDAVADEWPDAGEGWTHFAERYTTARLVLDALTNAGYVVVRGDDLHHGDVMVRHQLPGREPTWDRVRRAF